MEQQLVIYRYLILDGKVDNMLHGKGQNQEFLTYSYLEKRRRGLLDKNNLSSDDLLYYDISGAMGGGRTDTNRYKMKQHPFPVDKSKKTIDVRLYMPELGEGSDV